MYHESLTLIKIKITGNKTCVAIKLQNQQFYYIAKLPHRLYLVRYASDKYKILPQRHIVGVSMGQ